MDKFTVFDTQSKLRFDIADDMTKMGIPVKTIHHECGPGQNEIELLAHEVVGQCDNTQTAKMIIKAHAHLKNLIGTLMPKPFLNQAGSGLHIHQILTKEWEKCVCRKEHQVSDILRHHVGGILAHVDEMTAITNPTTNSYKRLVPGHEAPVYKSWGVANRTALIRVPGYEKKARIEFRATDAACNLYLASALLLAAGLEGITNEIEPNAPTTENVEHLNEEERAEKEIGSLPGTLLDALDALNNSSFAAQCSSEMELWKSFSNKSAKNMMTF